MAADSVVESRQHSSMLYRGVVGQYINNHLDSIFVRTVAHGFEVVAVAEHIVAYFPVGRLVVVVPFAHNFVAGPAH